MDKKLDSGQWTVDKILDSGHAVDSGQKFGQCTFSSSFSEDSGQWTKTVNSSPGQGGVLMYPEDEKKTLQHSFLF